MISDMLRFLRIGFLFKKELDFEIRLLPAGELEGNRSDLSAPVCNGPYNQVTSQSFSLCKLVTFLLPWSGIDEQTYQLSVSGETVFSLFLDFVQVRHEAFSNLALFV